MLGVEEAVVHHLERDARLDQSLVPAQRVVLNLRPGPRPGLRCSSRGGRRSALAGNGVHRVAAPVDRHAGRAAVRLGHVLLDRALAAHPVS